MRAAWLLVCGVVAMVLATGAGAVRAGEDAGWVELFNGHDLSGWVATGDPAAWGVRDSEIAIVNPGSGGWLRTARTYRDFDLELDFWLPKDGNSGVGLRGASIGDPAFTGMEVQILDSHGQAPDVHNCGAVYEAIAPSAMAVKEAGTWNTYRIHLVGDRLSVWLNGKKIQDNEALDGRGYFRKPEQTMPLNERATTGYIALQDHGAPFRYRNIRIRDLSKDPEPEGMRMLITDDLSGWFPEDGAVWTVEDGTLVGRKGPGHLFTKERFGDFELRALVKVNDHGNSGMYFRVRPNPDPNNPWPIGYEAQVDQHDPKNFTGCIYDRAWPEDHSGPITRDNAWFDYRIRAVGDHIQTWINGVPMVDTQLHDFDRGSIAVQGHHPENVIMYRDIRVVEVE